MNRKGVFRLTRTLSTIAVLAALTGWAAAAEAAPGAIVMVLMDRSGSMVNNGQCIHSGTGTSFVDRKWVCGINDARDWVNNQDLAATNEYYFWQLASMPPDFSIMTIKAGPFTKAQMITQLNNFEIQGPLVDDASTPLAGAYCEAVDFLKQRRNDLTLPTLPLYLKLESDGLENSTPSGNECQGVDSGSGHAFVAGPITPLPAGGPYTSVNNLLVPSWQSNLLDKSITGVAHNPSNPPAFAASGFPATTIIAEITFLEQFIPPAIMAARLAPVAAASSGVDETAGSALGARAPSLAASLLSGPSTTEDYVSFLSGLASASGGRFTRVGSGAPFVPGDPNAPSPQPGDADGSLCVDQADGAILGRWLGKSVTPSNLESYEADLTKDGVIDLNDYTLLKAHYGEGCATPPAALPPLGYILFGFEDVSQWSSSAPLSLTGTPHSQGQFALTVGGKGRREVGSAAFDTSLVPANSCTVTLDVATTVPVTPPFPVSTRGPQLLVTIPSAGLYNESLKPVRPRAQPVNGFLTTSYRVPPRLSRALSKPHSDVVIKMVVEGNDSVTVDNLTFAAVCCDDD